MASVNVQYFALASETLEWIEPGLAGSGCDFYLARYGDRSERVFTQFADIETDGLWMLGVGFQKEFPSGQASTEVPAAMPLLMWVHLGMIRDGQMGESSCGAIADPPLFDVTRKIAGRIRRRTKTGLTVRNPRTGDNAVSSFLRYSPGAAEFARSGGRLVTLNSIFATPPAAN